MLIPLALKENSCDIVLERGCLAEAGRLLDLKRRVLIVTDTGVPAVYAIEDGAVTAWIQGTSTYSVVEETSLNCVFVLTSPSGCHYTALSVFTFMPSLA